ncbi:MAG TPA: hypothetical protein PKE04_10260, partial [Clostridia bacterium]|nr:hypothetical protein [Clostridia bacterium]
MTVEFRMLDAFGAYVPVQGFFYDETIAGITPLENVDLSASEAIPYRFMILNPADPSAALYDSSLTLSYAGSPSGLPATQPAVFLPAGSFPTQAAPTDAVPVVTPAPTFPADIPNTEHAYANAVQLPIYSDLGGTPLDYSLVNGDIVKVLDHVLGADGTWWSLISIGDVTGYVQTLDLRYMTPQEEELYLAPTPTPTEEPTASPSPSPTPTEEPTASPS